MHSYYIKMEKELIVKKNQLVEKLGVNFEHSEQLAPVAARILAFIILTGKVGATFEDLVSNLCASKSTISTHLNHLQDLNKISYFTKMALILSVLLNIFDAMNTTITFVDDENTENAILYKPVKSIAPMIFPFVIKSAENQEVEETTEAELIPES